MNPIVTFLGGCAHGWKTEDPRQERFVAVQFPMPPAPLRISADLRAPLKTDVYQRHTIQSGDFRFTVYALAGMELIDALSIALQDCHTYRSQT
jgi:hypothetical protein